jgi:hypothetical protein
LPLLSYFRNVLLESGIGGLAYSCRDETKKRGSLQKANHVSIGRK